MPCRALFPTGPKLMNRISKHLAEKPQGNLAVYFTAGYPRIEDTGRIVRILDSVGVDMVEIGIPYSDPVADGPVIQASAAVALGNRMNLAVLFDQLAGMRSHVGLPILLMGYFNPIMQFGVESFFRACHQVGVDGVVIPDLPLEVFAARYQESAHRWGLCNTYLATPTTPEDRVRLMDRHTEGFLYVVSDSQTTGSRKDFAASQLAYFQRIRDLGLKHPTLIGFGVYSHRTFRVACEYSSGGIVGSAFIQQLGLDAGENAVAGFIRQIRDGG